MTPPTEPLCDDEPATGAIDRHEVDTTLIREMLDLSPEERLRWHEQTRLQALELQDAFRTSR